MKIVFRKGSFARGSSYLRVCGIKKFENLKEWWYLSRNKNGLWVTNTPKNCFRRLPKKPSKMSRNNLYMWQCEVDVTVTKYDSTQSLFPPSLSITGAVFGNSEWFMANSGYKQGLSWQRTGPKSLLFIKSMWKLSRRAAKADNTHIVIYLRFNYSQSCSSIVWNIHSLTT